MSEVTIEVPIRTVSEVNSRENWRKKNARKQGQQFAVGAMLGAETMAIDEIQPPYLVTLTRIGKRLLDDDNCASSFKGIRDSVASFLLVDDGDTKAVLWKYRQETGKDYAVRISIKSRRRAGHAGMQERNEG